MLGAVKDKNTSFSASKFWTELARLGSICRPFPVALQVCSEEIRMRLRSRVVRYGGMGTMVGL